MSMTNYQKQLIKEAIEKDWKLSVRESTDYWKLWNWTTKLVVEKNYNDEYFFTTKLDKNYAMVLYSFVNNGTAKVLDIFTPAMNFFAVGFYHCRFNNGEAEIIYSRRYPNSNFLSGMSKENAEVKIMEIKRKVSYEDDREWELMDNIKRNLNFINSIPLGEDWLRGLNTYQPYYKKLPKNDYSSQLGELIEPSINFTQNLIDFDKRYKELEKNLLNDYEKELISNTEISINNAINFLNIYPFSDKILTTLKGNLVVIKRQQEQENSYPQLKELLTANIKFIENLISFGENYKEQKQVVDKLSNAIEKEIKEKKEAKAKITELENRNKLIQRQLEINKIEKTNLEKKMRGELKGYVGYMEEEINDCRKIISSEVSSEKDKQEFREQIRKLETKVDELNKFECFIESNTIKK